MNDDGSTTPTSSNLETMPKENLIKLVQRQIILKKKLDARIAELTTSCRNFEVRFEKTSKRCEDVSNDEIAKQCLDSLLNQIEREDQRIRRALKSFDLSKFSSPVTLDDLDEFLRNFLQNQTNSISQIQNDERIALMFKREQQMTDLLEMKMNEVKILTERVENLDDDLKEYRKLVFEKTKEADDLDRQLQIEQNETKDLKEKQQKLKLLLTRLKKELDEKNAQQQQPKQSLVDLEIADYERTIKTLKENLEKKEKENDELRQNFDESTRRISMLEIDSTNFDERAKKFEHLYETTRKELENVQDLENERHQNDDNVRQLLDKFQLELDNSKILLSQFASEKHQLNDRLQQQTETSQRTIQILEQNLRIAQHDYEIVRKDLETLQDDFQNYKIRAQSVLKQQQTIPRESSTSIMTKNAELEEINEKLRQTIDELNEKLRHSTDENERLTDLQTKLTAEWKKRENELKKKQQNVENDFQKRLNESHELVTNLNVHNENLSKSFQEQIESIRDEYERLISILKIQLENSQIEMEKLKISQDSTQISTINNDESPWNSAERQQGEGSESTSNDFSSSDIAVKTLENVLFGRSSKSIGDERPRHVLFEDEQIERQRLEDEFNKMKFRLNNTTELLNESELNNVRLSEQVTLLKDEIRRLERNIERTESISNFEYLKNIILKFFILKTSVERLQLIPVLVTMLKLSPEEQEQLTHVAQQSSTSIQMNSSNSTENNSSIVTNNSNSSWTSYLNLW